MIPKRVFFFWGNQTMSWMRYMTLKSFRQLNPDWEVTLYHLPCSTKNKPWLEHNEQDFFCFTGKDYFPRVNALGIEVKEWNLPAEYRDALPTWDSISASHKSNFFKWFTLTEDGGIYLDLDILFIRPFGSFYDQIRTFDTVFCYKDWLSIGVLAATKNNQFFQDTLLTAIKNYGPKKYQCAGVESIYRLLYKNFTAAIIASKDALRHIEFKYPDARIFNIPMEYFYFWIYDELDKLFCENHTFATFPKETLGVNWYAGHPTAQKWNNILTEDNYKEYTNTFCNLIVQGEAGDYR